MENRIAQFWSSIDALLAASSHEAQQEGERLAQSPFTAQHPLEVFLDRKYLKAVIGVSVRQMQRHLADHHDHEAVRLQLGAEIARREAFLTWLDSDPDLQVYMNVYPGTQFPIATPHHDDTPQW